MGKKLNCCRVGGIRGNASYAGAFCANVNNTTSNSNTNNGSRIKVIKFPSYVPYHSVKILTHTKETKHEQNNSEVYYYD